MKAKTVAPAFIVKFWGVRGSVPSPLVADDVEEKILRALCADRFHGAGITPENFLQTLPFHVRGTYGGNTSCVEVRAGEKRIVLDLGTGARPLGNSLMQEMFANKGLDITFLLSHIHWDHIQGLPFFAPLHFNKNQGINNRWTFYGGTRWQEVAQDCLAGQMDPPTFPVSWREIEKITASMEMSDVYDMMSFEIAGSDVHVRTRKLDHPQETYGWRLERQGKIVVYTTDNEPRDPLNPAPGLVDLAKDADLWITDCQYSHDVYHGISGGVARYGWGHSYPDAVAATAAKAGVKHVVLFHHDPASSDKKISEMEETVGELLTKYGSSASVSAAYEGLEIQI